LWFTTHHVHVAGTHPLPSGSPQFDSLTEASQDNQGKPLNEPDRPHEPRDARISPHGAIRKISRDVEFRGDNPKFGFGNRTGPGSSGIFK
jgi:hypothetical protein